MLLFRDSFKYLISLGKALDMLSELMEKCKTICNIHVKFNVIFDFEKKE